MHRAPRHRLLPLLLLALALLAPAEARAAELKLSTWNIAWLTLRPAGDPTLPNGLPTRSAADLDRLAAYARRLDADVVALQEVDGPRAAARIFDPAAFAFIFAEEADVQRTGFAIRRGLTVIRNPDLAALDVRAGARRSLRRGTDITLETPSGARLRLLAIHLNAGCREGRLARADRECETLAAQVEVLAEWVAARRREGIPFAIMGDFNRRMTGPRDDLLDALGPPPLRRATEGVSDPCWAGARGPRPFIDHILLGGGAERWYQRDSLRVMVYAERDFAQRPRLSDHCPISIRLRIE